MQSNSPLVQLSGVKVTKEKVLGSTTVLAPLCGWIIKLESNKSMIMNMVVVLWNVVEDLELN